MAGDSGGGDELVWGVGMDIEAGSLTIYMYYFGWLMFISFRGQ